MAEVLGVIASGISVAQITFQFVGFAHKLQQLHDLPDELQKIFTDLELLRQLLSPLVSALDSSGKVDASSENLHDSIVHCNEVASSLCTLATKLNKNSDGSIVKRSLGILKTGLRKDEIRTMEMRLGSSKTSLLLAMAVYASVDRPSFSNLQILIQMKTYATSTFVDGRSIQKYISRHCAYASATREIQPCWKTASRRQNSGLSI